MKPAIKLALLGVFAALGLAFITIYEKGHGTVVPAILAGVFALAAIWAGCGVLDTYKGDKR